MSEYQKEADLKDIDDVDEFGHPQIPYCNDYDKQFCDGRLKWAEKFGNCSLEQCGQWWLNEGTHDSCSCQTLKGNIENPIGLAKVPLGLCGPLLFKGERVEGYHLLPLATTEGSVIASINRGATALNRSGGVHVKVLEQTQIRSTYFLLRNSVEVVIFLKWIVKNIELMRQRVRGVSEHAQLRKTESTHFDRAVVVHFYYSTEDACGQDMVTSCTNDLCEWIQSVVETDLPQVKLSFYFIETGLSGGKRIEFIDHWRTRGFRVQAEAWIPKSVMESTLKVDIAMFLACYEAFKTGMCAAGAKGFTINVSNLVTGVCIATGQDAASVKSSHAQLTVSPLTAAEWKDLGRELDENLDDDAGYAGVYVTIVLPSLNVGTVGGGTALATQMECLNLTGCGGKNGAGPLCEMIGGYSLGLEISILSSVASGQFTTAVDTQQDPLGFQQKDFNTTFFSNVIGVDCILIDAKPFEVDARNSILSNLSMGSTKIVGHLGYTIKYLANGHPGSIDTVTKAKATGIEVANVLNAVAQALGPEAGAIYKKHAMKHGFQYTDIREVEMYRIPELHRFLPKVYYTQMIPDKEVYLIVMEYLSDEKFTHMNTEDDISVWTPSDIKVVLRDLAALHAVHFNKTSKLEAFSWLGMIEGEDKQEVWTALLKAANSKFSRFWTDERCKLTNEAVKNIGKIDSVLKAAPKTLIQNDCNPRNICLRKPETNRDASVSTDTDSRRMCIYDWELALVGTPQRDLFEFLAFILEDSASIETWLELVHFYRCHLEECTGIEYPAKRFIQVLNRAAWDFTIKRLLLYTLPCCIKEYVFIDRVMGSAFKYLEHAHKTDSTIFSKTKL